MSNSVAPLPSGIGVASIAEHRPRRDPEGHHPADDEPPADDHNSPSTEQPQAEHHDTPAPVADEAVVPAETLFATALLANIFTPSTPSPEEVKLRTSQGWTPPESSLRLKDKLI